MKKLFSVIFMAAAFLAACSNDDKGDGGDNGMGTPVDGLVYVHNGHYYLGNGNQAFSAPTGDYKLDASITYTIRGWVYIEEGSTLTIPAGTILKGKSANNKVEGSSLIIEPGAKIFAEGTADKPIVFTSDKAPGHRKPGDWGGVIICGKAPNNQGTMQIEGGPKTRHGGSDPEDNSGVFTYCRIEFAGYPFDTDMEINGLTLGSVGAGTEMHHIQVSYSNDDSFEWFGGTVNSTHLIAYHGWDDDFDTDNGFSGTLQYLLSVRHPMIADQSVSNGFESDNWADGTGITPLTSAKFANVTLVGPIGQDDNFINQTSYITAGSLYPDNGSRVGQYQAGMQIRRGSNISVYNTLVMGWPVGVMIDNNKQSATQDLATANPERFQNIFFGGYTDNGIVTYDNAAKGAYPILGSDRNKAFGDWFNSFGDESTGKEEDGNYINYDDKSRISFSHDFIMNKAIGTRLFPSIDDVMLAKPVSVKNLTATSFEIEKEQNYGPLSGSPLKGTFTLPAGFKQEGSSYVGAFASDSPADDWTRGWAEFDPQNAVY